MARAKTSRRRSAAAIRHEYRGVTLSASVAEAIRADLANVQSWIVDAADKRTERERDAVFFSALRVLRGAETILAAALVQAAQGDA